MRYIVLCCVTFMLILGCEKSEHGTNVEIYMLKSFTVNIDQTTNPPTLTISNAILEDAPLVADRDIEYYTASSTTFKLKKDIKPTILNYGSDKAFAVTVDGQPVYYGKFHPGYLSSISFGLATIDPILFHDNNLVIQFATISGSSSLQHLDKRNDDLITESLKASGRLR